MEIVWGKSKVKNFNSPVLSLFMEDGFGQPILDEVKEEVRRDLFGYWNNMHNDGKILKNYMDLGFKRREDFHKTMEGKFPWLHLCKGHWKVKQLWINYFSSWKKTHLPPSLDSKNPSPGPSNIKGKTLIDISLDDDENLKDKALINISSDISDNETPENSNCKTLIEISSDEDNTPISFKRRHEDSEQGLGPLKRLKGKGKEVTTSDPYPTRPIPKKINARIGKVNNSFLFIRHLLKIHRLTHCTGYSHCFS